METVVDYSIQILQWLYDNPEVTWSGAGFSILTVLWFVLRIFCKFPPSDNEKKVDLTSNDTKIIQGDNNSRNIQTDHVENLVNGNLIINPPAASNLPDQTTELQAQPFFYLFSVRTKFNPQQQQQNDFIISFINNGSDTTNIIIAHELNKCTFPLWERKGKKQIILNSMSQFLIVYF